jgi:6-phosphogluconolactonase (cycloisomerase 2 family)
MKFTKFGKALLISALSAGVVVGVSSCVRSYTVGFLYVTGTVTGETANNGIISGYKIDHNTGKLTEINGLPVASGGANPIRAVLLSGSRFVYVLNRGVNSAGTGECSGTSGSTLCTGANIELFAIGANGILTPQATYYTQGLNPFRMIADSSGTFLMVLDHDAPDSGTLTGSSNSCTKALGSSTTTCGDVTMFKIDGTTGRLSTVTNAQVTSASGSTLSYFPVPANPIDFILNSSNLLTLSGTPAAGDSVYPYAYSSTTGQLTASQSSAQTLGISHATGMVVAGGYLYVMDNSNCLSGCSSTTSQIIPYTVGTGGSLSAQTTGAVQLDSTLGNPSWIIAEAKSKYIYVAAAGNNRTGSNLAESGIGGYNIESTSPLTLKATVPATFGSGSGPQCIVEDPSDQFIYTANYNDSTVTGRLVDPNAGILSSLKSTSTFKLSGPPTWCFVDGRTN